MVNSRQRERQLARAKWERQLARRSADATRRRWMGIAAGVLAALIAGAALIWLILHIVDTEHTRSDNQPVPSFPSATSAASPGTGTGSASAPPTSAGDSGTGTSRGTSPTSRSSSQPTRGSSSQGGP